MKKNNAVLMSFMIARLSLLLGMACNGLPRERLKAHALLQKELPFVHSLLNKQHICSICGWLNLMECLPRIPSEIPALPNYLFDLNELKEEFISSESPVFNHTGRSCEDILTELFVYGHATLIANPSIRKRCRTASNYYIDHCGVHPLIFRQARMSLSISLADVNRWYTHKSWVWLISDPVTNNTKR